MADPGEARVPRVRVAHYKRRLLRIAEVWFEETDSRPDADIVELAGMPRPVDGSIVAPAHTLIVPLCHPDEGAILMQMEQSTRYQIRLAESRDKLKYEHSRPGSLSELSKFTDAYADEIARGNPSMRLNLERLSGLAEAGVLDLSTTRDEHDEVLTWHVNVVGRRIVRMLHSVTILSAVAEQQAKNARGRANRYHYWMDMRRFRAEGVEGYDFGGWYTGQEDRKKLQINRFKRGFGGDVVCQYNCLYPLTIRGWAALKLRGLARRGA
jgi:lipid II:glycine glycyltransferase (peptidoglycan interpeptide bridge formation enzyme)